MSVAQTTARGPYLARDVEKSAPSKLLKTTNLKNQTRALCVRLRNCANISTIADMKHLTSQSELFYDIFHQTSIWIPLCVCVYIRVFVRERGRGIYESTSV